ncbi:hypothetical protein H8S77_02430 [Parabacteroides sp. BX2]|uniref:Arm DNA-binding domain-containing protein n=1 Tax=Parabacteroides segnis TaxID=2763058 RepID=A0ABR7DW46_9BACT|nr:hypothetical protein [Parabacteroides segnis]
MSATISIVCHKYESPLMIRICKDRKMKYESIGVSLEPRYWFIMYDFNIILISLLLNI